MLTNDAMSFIKEIMINSYYPTQKARAGELEGFWEVFENAFNRYDEQDVTDAVERVIETSTYFPTVAMIKTALDDVLRDKHRRSRTRRAGYIDMPRDRTIPESVKKAMNEAKKGRWTAPISTELRQYAQWIFPGITDELIRKNYGILCYWKGRARNLDNPKYAVKLVMLKDGWIYEIAAPVVGAMARVYK